jgi:molybdate-binding protein/DNA-binding XRE family transcriptional regulator
MSGSKQANQIKTWRVARGWSQAELAERTGISRTAISAIEGRRMVPSVAAAMALAKVFETTVEELFSQSAVAPSATWAFETTPSASSYWQAEVAGRIVRFPAHASPMLTPLPDGHAENEMIESHGNAASNQTLVMACCDPAAGLLASLYAQSSGLRLLVLPRSSRQSLEMLQQGLVHLAGLHLSTDEEPELNAEVVRSKLGGGYQLVRLAQWQEGVTLDPKLKLKSVRAAIRSKLTWIGREVGSGARQCLDRLLSERTTPRREARHHRGVAEAVQAGWADAGICVRLSSAEAGLDFLPVQQEAYDVCFSSALLHDRRVQAFLNVVRSAAYRHLLSELPGYSSAETGNLWSVN